MNPSVREELLGRFTAWLDEALAEEALPPGLEALVDGEPQAGEVPDLHALLSGLAVVAQEVKLQGRAFQSLHDAVAPLCAGDRGKELSAAVEQLAGELRGAAKERERAAVREAEARREREHVELLVELRERLCRGLGAAREQLARLHGLPPPSRLARLLGRGGEALPSLAAATSALADGQELSLGRLDEVLRRLRVEEIQCLSRPFDPHRMRAVALEERSDAAEGTVLEVLRPGYLLDGEPLRVAEVKVSRGPRAAPGGGVT